MGGELEREGASDHAGEVAQHHGGGEGDAEQQRRAMQMRKRATRRKQTQPGASAGTSHADAHPAAGAAHADSHHAEPAHNAAAPAGEPGVAAAEQLKIAVETLGTRSLHDWNHALTQLDANKLRMAGGDALQQWGLALVFANQMHGTPMAMAIDPWLLAARQYFGKFAARSYKGIEILGQPPPLPKDPTSFMQQTIARTAHTIEHVNRMLALCGGAKPDAKGGRTLPPAAEVEIANLFNQHNSLEIGFINAVLVDHDMYRVVTHMGGIAGMMVSGQEDQRADEAAASRHWKKRVDPGTIAGMRPDVDRIEALVSDHQTLAPLYLQILKKYAPDERSQLIALIEVRGFLLENMVHLADGDVVEDLVHATPGWESWVYRKQNVTEHTRGEMIRDSALDAARLLPGGACNFVAGVYDGMGHLPLVGGAFKHAADSFRDLGKFADDECGARADMVSTRNLIANTAGRIEYGIMEGGAVAELDALEAANTFRQGMHIKEGYDAAKTAKHVGEFVLDIRSAWNELNADWNFLADTVNEAYALAIDLTAAKDDKAKFETAIDHASKICDAGLASLSRRAKRGFTEEGHKQEEEKEKKKQEKPQTDDEVMNRALPPELKRERAAMVTAVQRLIKASTPEEREAAQSDVLKHKEKITELANQYDTFKNAAKERSTMEASRRIDEAKEARAKKEEEKEQKQAAKGQDQAGAESRSAAGEGADQPPGLGAKVKHGIVETLKEGLIEFGIGALTEVKKQLVELLKASATPGKHAAFDPALAALKAGCGAAAKAGIEIATPKINMVLKTLIHAQYRASISRDYADVTMAILAPQIDKLLKWGEDKLKEKFKLEEKLADWLVEMIAGPLGLKVEKKEGEKKEGEKKD